MALLYRVDILSQHQSSQLMTTLYYAVPNGDVPADIPTMQALASFVDTNIVGKIAACVADETVFTDIVVKQIDETKKPQPGIIATRSLNSVGSRGQNTSGSFIVGVISLNGLPCELTGVGRGMSRSNLRIGPLTETDCRNDQTLTAALITLLQDVAVGIKLVPSIGVGGLLPMRLGVKNKDDVIGAMFIGTANAKARFSTLASRRLSVSL